MSELAQSSHTVRGYCALCTAHCATIATVSEGRVVRLDPDHDHPNGGVICIKGKAAPELVYHPDRLDYPLKRTRPKNDPDPGWQRVSWDEALDDIARRINAIRESDGARAVALAKGTTDGTSISDAERWLSRFLNFFGSPTGYLRPTFATGTKTLALVTRLASRFPPPTSRAVTFSCSGDTTRARRH